MPIHLITPDEVAGAKVNVIPDVVFESFNYLIVLGWTGHSSTVKQQEVVDLIRSKLSAETVFENRWLDVEPAYREVGWVVVYDKPGYCETYDPTYKFTRKSK